MERFFYFFIKGKWKRLKTHTHQKNQNQKTTHNINQPTKKPTDKSNAGAKGVSSHFLDGPKFIRWGYLKAMRMPSHTQPVSITVYLPKESWKKDARSWGGAFTPVLSHGSSSALYLMGSYNKNTILRYLSISRAAIQNQYFFNLHIYKLGTGKIFKPWRHPVSSQEEVSLPIAATDTWGGRG